jgi:3-hydroxyacyl-CoA dehydrogenase
VGRGWAISFARAGHEVILWDREPQACVRARDDIAAALPGLAAADLLAGREPQAVFASISTETNLASALAGAAYVQENAPEDLATKQAVFAEIDRLSPPDAILASSTSGLLPSLFTTDLNGRARCLVAHPLNPPHLVPLVEIVPAPCTSTATVERTVRFLAEAGHVPVIVRHEIEGFVVNRLQAALLDEAFRLVAEGYASAGDIDACIREGLALRWCFMGPFETIDLNAPRGLRDYVARYMPLYRRILSRDRTPISWDGPVLEDVESVRRTALPLDLLSARQDWRDRRLMALAAHKRSAAQKLGD